MAAEGAVQWPDPSVPLGADVGSAASEEPAEEPAGFGYVAL